MPRLVECAVVQSQLHVKDTEENGILSEATNNMLPFSLIYLGEEGPFLVTPAGLLLNVYNSSFWSSNIKLLKMLNIFSWHISSDSQTEHK